MSDPTLNDQICAMLHRDPFRLFKIVLTSGKEYEVTNPDVVAVGATEFTIYAPKTDEWVMLRKNQVASVESIQQAA